MRNAEEMAALCILDGLEFPPGKPLMSSVIFQEAETAEGVSKAIVTVLKTQRAHDLVTGAKSIMNMGQILPVRVYTAGAVRKGLSMRLEGALCTWVKKLISLGLGQQQLMWQIIYCLQIYGIPARSAYLDDEGAVRRLTTVNTNDFQLRVEFYDAGWTTQSAMIYNQIVAAQKPAVFEGSTVHDSAIRSDFAIRAIQTKKLGETHPYKLMC